MIFLLLMVQAGTSWTTIWSAPTSLRAPRMTGFLPHCLGFFLVVVSFSSFHSLAAAVGRTSPKIHLALQAYQAVSFVDKAAVAALSCKSYIMEQLLARKANCLLFACAAFLPLELQPQLNHNVASDLSQSRGLVFLSFYSPPLFFFFPPLFFSFPPLLSGVGTILCY